MSYAVGTHVRTFLAQCQREDVTSSPVILVVRDHDGSLRFVTCDDYRTAQREDIPRVETYGGEVLMVIEGESSAISGEDSVWVPR